MTREIKFRAWNKTEKKMVDLHKITPLALDANMNTQLALQGEDGLFLPFIKDMPLMQFTGLCDKNGTEIYEGDILERFEDDKYFGVVEYFEGRFICNMPKESPIQKRPLWKCVQTTSSPHNKVIGNIHENPELLESK